MSSVTIIVCAAVLKKMGPTPQRARQNLFVSLSKIVLIRSTVAKFSRKTCFCCFSGSAFSGLRLRIGPDFFSWEPVLAIFQFAEAPKGHSAIDKRSPATQVARVETQIRPKIFGVPILWGTLALSLTMPVVTPPALILVTGGG